MRLGWRHAPHAAVKDCSNSSAHSSLTPQRRVSAMLASTWQCMPFRLLATGLFGIVFACGPWRFSLHAQDYPPDRARGKAVYERHCQSCHGPTGRGDGPAAASLKISPADFQRFQSFLKSDEELLRTIEHGVVFSPMHSWRGQLTDGEMQDVVAYIRLLSQQTQ